MIASEQQWSRALNLARRVLACKAGSPRAKSHAARLQREIDAHHLPMDCQYGQFLRHAIKHAE